MNLAKGAGLNGGSQPGTCSPEASLFYAAGNREDLPVPPNTVMGSLVVWSVPVRLLQRWAACRPSPFTRPAPMATATFLLGPKLFEGTSTHLLLLAKGRGGGRREVPEGRTENALKQSQERGRAPPPSRPCLAAQRSCQWAGMRTAGAYRKGF